MGEIEPLPPPPSPELLEEDEGVDAGRLAAAADDGSARDVSGLGRGEDLGEEKAGDLEMRSLGGDEAETQPLGLRSPSGRTRTVMECHEKVSQVKRPSRVRAGACAVLRLVPLSARSKK